VINFASAWKRALTAGSAQTAEIYGTGGALSWQAVARYLGNLINTGPAIYLILLAILAAAFGRKVPRAGKDGLLLCAVWFLPILLLAFGHYRDLRYAAPLFPSVALATGILTDWGVTERGIQAWAAVCVVLALTLAGMLDTSFGILGQRRFELGGVLLVQRNFAQARKYDRTSWPQSAILQDILRESRVRAGTRERVLVATDNVHFNADNFELAAALGRLPFDFGSTAYESDPAMVAAAVHSNSFLIYKEGGESDEPHFNSLGAAAIREANESGTFKELPLACTLPDGGVAHVLENLARGGPVRTWAFVDATLQALDKCDVRFSDRIQLAGCTVTREGDRLRVRLRWVALKRMDRDYWCFAHVLDATGKVVGFLDHPIANGSPSTRDWKSADEAFEELLFVSKQSRLRLRLGVYDPGSGERLRISRSEFAVTDDQTAAIINERGTQP
jgi:hypothetical protein